MQFTDHQHWRDEKNLQLSRGIWGPEVHTARTEDEEQSHRKPFSVSNLDAHKKVQGLQQAQGLPSGEAPYHSNVLDYFQRPRSISSDTAAANYKLI